MIQASTLTFVRLSGTSENWRRTSRSCITVVRRDKWKNQIPKRAGTMDKSTSTGIKYWVCCIKETCLISQFVHNLFWLKLKWNARSKLFYCYHLSSLLWWKFKDIDKISRNLRNVLMNGNINIWNIRTRITPERTRKNYRIPIWRQI